METNKKVYLSTVIKDILSLVGKGFWILSFIVFLVTLVMTYGDHIMFDCLTQQIVNVMPTLMGFLITGLAIIMGLNGELLKRLSETADDGEIPLMVIVACFVVCFGFLLLSFSLSLFYIFIDFKCKCIGFLTLYCVLESILSLYHVILHLFSTCTHLLMRK